MAESEAKVGDRAHKRTVAVDLDGVLAQYDGWKGIDHIGDPIPGAKEFLEALRERFDVVIFTTRCNSELNREGANLLRNRVRDWLDRHALPYDHIYAEQGKPAAAAYIDDRAVSCRPEDAADAEARAATYLIAAQTAERLAYPELEPTMQDDAKTTPLGPPEDFPR